MLAKELHADGFGGGVAQGKEIDLVLVGLVPDGLIGGAGDEAVDLFLDSLCYGVVGAAGDEGAGGDLFFLPPKTAWAGWP